MATETSITPSGGHRDRGIVGVGGLTRRHRLKVALSEMPVACRGAPRKRLPPSMRIMREAPDLALPIS